MNWRNFQALLWIRFAILIALIAAFCAMAGLFWIALHHPLVIALCFLLSAGAAVLDELIH